MNVKIDLEKHLITIITVLIALIVPAVYWFNTVEERINKLEMKIDELAGETRKFAYDARKIQDEIERSVKDVTVSESRFRELTYALENRIKALEIYLDRLSHPHAHRLPDGNMSSHYDPGVSLSNKEETKGEK